MTTWASWAKQASWNKGDDTCEDCGGTGLVTAYEVTYKAADGWIRDWPKGAPLPSLDCPICGGKR